MRSILTDSLSQVFGPIKLHKKESRNNFFDTLESYRDFEVNVLVLRYTEQYLTYKVSITNAVLKIYLKINTQVKKYIFIVFFMQICWTKNLG